jgi:hypothetical protein
MTQDNPKSMFLASIEQQSRLTALISQKTDSFEQTMEWQKKLHDATDALVAERLKPFFNEEFWKRCGSTHAEQKEASKWAHRVLNDARLCAVSPNGRPSGFQPIPARGEKGNIYLLEHTEEGANRTYIRFRIEPGTPVSLCGITPRRFNNNSLSR